MEMNKFLDVIFSLYLIVFSYAGFYLYSAVWLKPQKILNKLRQQGIQGPPPSFLTGNLTQMKGFVSEQKVQGQGLVSHDYTSKVFPYFYQWRKEYGPIFCYLLRNVPALHVSHPDMVKDISLCVSLDLGKATYLRKTHEPLLGHGILKSNGAAWAYQRKIIAPEFFLDKVKCMVDLMVDSSISLLKSWETEVEQGGGIVDLKVDEDLRSYSADVISRACFGSSYTARREIFVKLRALQKAVCRPNLLAEITGLRCLSLICNREVWRLKREVRDLILKVVNEGGGERNTSGKNLLQSMLRSAYDGYAGPGTIDCFIVDNCKSICFAGHETTAVTATWCLMLLGLHSEWQERARAEVTEVLGDRLPDAHSLQKMKTLTMVIQETLRLYPPGVYVARETLQEMKLGGFDIPKGVNVFIPVPTLHHDPSIWGPNAREFNPERFAAGVVGACQLPHMYIPFGVGTRTCLGQNFAMAELKIILSLVLSKFSFSLSPSYRHSPTLRLIVEPEFGVNLLVKKV